MGAGHITAWGALGVLIITAGLYLLHTRPELEGKRRKDEVIDLWTPFRRLRQEKGSWLMLWVSVIFAFTATFDYIAWENANAPFYLLVDHGLAGGISALLGMGYYFVRGVKVEELFPQKSWWPLLLYGVVIAASVIPHMASFIWIPVVPYVISCKRVGLILFTVGIGICLGFLKRFEGCYRSEAEHLAYRVPGTLMMVIGMVIIIFWGKG